MFKVIIAGSRSFTDYALLKAYADFKLSAIQDEIEIVSGGAKGADSLGERYAKEKGYRLRIFPADWQRFGKSAGYKRNAQMAAYAEALLAFWDGKSPGTRHMIDLARDNGLKIGVKVFILKIHFQGGRQNDD